MKKALYFMPDISGFTNFVNNTEVEHSIHIIAELLEILLDSTVLDLELVEIEGDALFMFTTTIPEYSNLMEQTNRMLEAFHKHTVNYDKMRICDCGSCRTTTNLELKFLVHYGDLSYIKVKHIVKPYGRDVIQIHRLLKNKITTNEYILFTNSVFELYKKQMDNSWQRETGIYDAKVLDYFYKNLEQVRNAIVLKASLTTSQNEDFSTPVLVLEKIFNASIHSIYSYLSELKYRHLWDKNIKRVEFNESKINRVGTEHNCVLSLGNLKFKTITAPSEEDLVYGEKTANMMFTKNYSYLVKLHKIDETSTQVVLNVYLDFTTVGTMMRPSILNMIRKMWEEKLTQLHQVSKNNIQL
ncbi:DUF2652 domain-containing protein [Flavobacterium frigidarium]|uniref:DUF2652 domain-containing protein n=1 Tax=Flavobacterium frigidarium TaxID=99286 RepID=UPI0012F998FE|nr:DUF2652 domain-containing protein [Flavobacterium frigidarium]